MATDRPPTQTQTDLPPMPEIDGLTPRRWRVYVTMIDLRRRLGRGVTLAEIARAMGVSRQYVSREVGVLVDKCRMVVERPGADRYHRYQPANGGGSPETGRLETTMSTAERDYDLLHNEGGEGYNPVRAAREAADDKADAAYAATPEAKLERLRRRADAMRAAKIDHGGYTDDQIAAVEAEIADLSRQIDADADARFVAEWTRDVTIARRDEWNARVRAGEFTFGGGRVDHAAVARAEATQGWRRDDLRRALKMHNL